MYKNKTSVVKFVQSEDLLPLKRVAQGWSGSPTSLWRFELWKFKQKC